ncbi:MAG: pyroglutamyl-peptidase I [Candidatus Microbacterium phytovorans]|uniref:Pyroglutamyl-peptidase I n=1 Tax=Candidatus Microbacterium phytovorans TaxID=3121374 RepID=A0AAJ6B438_9MICO|nr:pyroglutamyl-peptidase I [Microbacterium sp.]WEK13957.1 MAG: pyroglutamyl-peptidase I [Microbacterium sp.]
MTTLLLTGFEPFGGDRANPSGDAVREVATTWSGPEELIVEVLPVTFAGAARRLRELIGIHRPDVVLATGLAGGRAAIGVERIAVNLVDARIPDNAGAQPIDEPSIAGAPPAAFATVPVKAIAARIREAGIPAEVSHSAGTFVCNHVFFTALDAVPDGAVAGFLHVPWATGQAPAAEPDRPDSPELPLADIVEALRIAVRTTLDAAANPAGDAETGDLPGGALH